MLLIEEILAVGDLVFRNKYSSQKMRFINFQFDRLDLIGQQYYIDVGVYEQDWAYAYDYHWHAYPLLVRSTGGEKGILHPPHRWRLEDVLARHTQSSTPEVINGGKL